MTSQDYRVSTIVILCKDCGNDVGAYPGRHKCPPPPAMPAMPSIPSRYMQSNTPPPSSSRTNGRRPTDPGHDSYGSGSGSGSRTPTASSFQDRMRERDREKQQREREEREAAARAVREETSTPTPSTTASTAATAGTTFWSKLMAAKDVINATITGEERWPDSDDSDYEGETHVGRVLREYNDKKDAEELAAKIAELDATPIGSVPKGAGYERQQYSSHRGGSSSGPSSVISTTSSNDREDLYGRSLRNRGDPPAGSERSWSPAPSHLNPGPPTGNRHRTSSDASRDDALSRLEGKKEEEKLAAHVNNLGSTSPRSRGASPNRAPRQQDGPPAQHQYGNQLSPSSAGGSGAAAYQNYSSSAPTRRYDSPSPTPGASSGRYGGQQQQQQPSYGNNSYGGNNNYRQQPPSRGDPYGGSPARGSPDPSMGYGRPEYERRPTYPPTGGPPPSGPPSSGPPSSGSNLGAYGQRQQQRNQYQQHTSHGARGNYF
ncbi:hypothetical protein BGX34_009907 [Mortierella sp. NVP85]|nr:hypothetical protein BGX34_009907 [Mortierella sp. NVP85]